MHLQPILLSPILGQVAERVDVAQAVPAVCVHLLRQLLVCKRMRNLPLPRMWRVHAVVCMRDDAKCRDAGDAVTCISLVCAFAHGNRLVALREEEGMHRKSELRALGPATHTQRSDECADEVVESMMMLTSCELLPEFGSMCTNDGLHCLGVWWSHCATLLRASEQHFQIVEHREIAKRCSKRVCTWKACPGVPSRSTFTLPFIKLIGRP